MIVEISSENPQLMSILQKNPNSFEGLQFKSLKNGTAIGRIVSDKEYHMVFHDTKYSFCGDFSSQIDYQSFCNPRVFLSMAGVFLRHMLVDKGAFFSQHIPWLSKDVLEVDTDNFKTTIKIPNVYADGFNLSRGFVLAKYFDEIKFERTSGCLHTMEVSANGVFRAVNLTALAMMYLASTNDQPWFINKDIAEKYIRVAKNLAPVPYFVLYLFARRCLPDKKLFDALKSELEGASELDVELKWGNTQVQRINAVEGFLLDKNDDLIKERIVLEVGCGEMDYPRKFLRKLRDGGKWYASDLNDYSHLASKISDRNPGKNLQFVHDLSSVYLRDTDTVMLCVEVIEHMPYELSQEFMAATITDHQPKRILITTPNKSFNQYYAIDGFRHNDHHFELTQKEFYKYIHDLLDHDDMWLPTDSTYMTQFFGIGDRVGDEYMSLGCVLERTY